MSRTDTISTVSPSSPFLPRLEALRGVAAMTVAVGHALAAPATAGWEEKIVRLLKLAANGHAAVSVFFVLSGLVLGLALRRWESGSIRRYWDFSLRRILRIWPAMIASLLLIALLLWRWPIMARPADVSGWFLQAYSAYAGAPSWHLQWSNMLLFDTSLNPVVWTLSIEFLCSLLLPALHLVSTSLRKRGKFILVLALVGWALSHSGNANLRPLFMFYLGYLLPEAGGPVARALPMNQPLGVFFGMLWIACLFGSAELSRRAPGTADVLEGLAAAALVNSVLHGRDTRLARVLEHGVVRFYGRISYSFYLLHFPALFVVCDAGLRLVPATRVQHWPVLAGFMLWIFSTVLATPFSWAVYRWVEVPGIHLGRRWCRRR